MHTYKCERTLKDGQKKADTIESLGSVFWVFFCIIYPECGIEESATSNPEMPSEQIITSFKNNLISLVKKPGRGS